MTRYCLILLVLAITCSIALSQRRRDGCKPAFGPFKQRLNSSIVRHPDRNHWPARLLRAAFHDCFAESCDGSIELELERTENARIEETLDFLRPIMRSMCVNLGDGLKIGDELALELSNAPRVKCHDGRMTRLAFFENVHGNLPFPNDDSADILRLFRRQGFTTREAMAGNFGGHALGGFSSRGQRFDFTPRIHRFSNNFARHAAGIESDDMQFSLLPSDRTLAMEEQAIVREFARDVQKFHKAFQEFTIKMCRM